MTTPSPNDPHEISKDHISRLQTIQGELVNLIPRISQIPYGTNNNLKQNFSNLLLEIEKIERAVKFGESLIP